MDSETTKKQIVEIDDFLAEHGPSVDCADLCAVCQAKLALVQALEIQERMEALEAETLGEVGMLDGSAGGGE
jgi:uncharacterized protein with PIN domain